MPEAGVKICSIFPLSHRTNKTLQECKTALNTLFGFLVRLVSKVRSVRVVRVVKVVKVVKVVRLVKMVRVVRVVHQHGLEVSGIALSSKCLKWQSVTKVALILFLMVLLICSAVHCLNSLKKIKCHSIEVEPELDRNCSDQKFKEFSKYSRNASSIFFPNKFISLSRGITSLFKISFAAERYS